MMFPFAPVSDSKLLARARRGDEVAFYALTERYRRDLRNFAFRITGNQRAAVEIAEEVIVRAWLSLHRYRPMADFKTWLLSIARHVCEDHARRKQALARHEVPLDGHESAAIADPEEIAEQRALAAVVRVEIATLPVAERQVVLRRYLRGDTCREIADELHISPEAVRMRLSRARKKLKKLFHDRGIGP